MEDKSRQGLFAPLLVGNLSFKDCGCVSATQGSSNGHEWFLIKPDHQTMVCAVCRSKVHVSIPADHQCISGQHHYHSYESSDFESRAACCKCHFPLIFIRVERRIQPEAWAKFLARDEKDQSNAVAFLMRLVRDFMNGKVRIGKANTGNKFFLENIGTWEDNGDLILKAISFVLDDEGFISPQQDLKSNQAIEEIDFEIFLMNGKKSHLEETKFEPALPILLRKLKATYNEYSPNISVVDLANESRLRSDYESLGCLPNMSDELIKDAYHAQTNDDPLQSPRYLQALLNIGQDRGSNTIQLEFALESSKNLHTLDDVNEAYQKLDVLEPDIITDEQLLVNYQYAIMKDTSNLDIYRKALKVLYETRKSEILEFFYISGDAGGQMMTDAMDVDVAPTVSSGIVNNPSLPVGLNNIGNTCYLNSLLQYYFTITVLRELVLLYDSSDLALPEAESDMTDAQLVQHLQTLFARLIFLDEASISPSKDLVDTALPRSTRSATGETVRGQQDISECMDKIMDMLELAFKQGNASRSVEASETIKKLFYGKTRQQLSFTTKTNTQELRVKEEVWNHLIVDVAPDIYSAFDSCFQSEKVELEGSEATRDVTISELPELLTIQINRVQFSRETGSTYKSKTFMEYPRSIFLDRYLDSNKVQVRERRELASALKEQVIQLQAKIDAFRTFFRSPPQDANSPPLIVTLPEPLMVSLKIAEQARDGLSPDLMFIEGASPDDLNETAKILAKEHESSLTELNRLTNLLTMTQSRQNTIYDDLRSFEYTLHAVFLHQGEAAYGHYWAYISDTNNNRWLKFNDSTVTEVPESDVFADTTNSPHNAYCMIYVGKNVPFDFIKTHLRSPRVREKSKAIVQNLDKMLYYQDKEAIASAPAAEVTLPGVSEDQVDASMPIFPVNIIIDS